jgi:4-hydroxy-tetrahydrodipicolinate reductase
LAEDVKHVFGLENNPSINAERIDGVFGIHKVKIKSQDEILEFYHEALNRKVFANGALQIAEWLFNQKKLGFYTMEDFLKDVNSNVRQS